MPKKSTTSKRTNSFKGSKKRPQWQLPLLAVLVAAAVGFGIFVVFFSKAGTTSPQVYLATSNNSSVATVPNSSGFTYGAAGDKIIACDWDGRPYGTLINGATVAAYRPSTSQFLISNNNASVSADPSLTFQFGDANSGDVPLCGNWDGSKTGNQSVATVGIYRPATATFYLASTNAQGGGAVETFVLGNPGDVPIACDWNGDGVTDLGLFRPSDGKFYMALRYGTWGVFRSFKYGNAGYTDYPVCGNWDGSAANDANFNYDTVGMYRTTDAKFYLRNTNAEGPADIVTPYGSPSDKFVPLVGNWTGTNQTFIGAYRQGVAETATPTNTTPTTAPGGGSTATPATIDGDANTCATKTLRKGNTGTCINVLHGLLATRGSQYQVDYAEAAHSTFGDSTVAKVRAFQSDRRIGIDGVVGPQTWAQLKIATTAGPAGPAGPQAPVTQQECNNERKDMATKLKAFIDSVDAAHQLSKKGNTFFTYDANRVNDYLNKARSDQQRLDTRNCAYYSINYVSSRSLNELIGTQLMTPEAALKDLKKVYSNGLGHVTNANEAIRQMIQNGRN